MVQRITVSKGTPWTEEELGIIRELIHQKRRETPDKKITISKEDATLIFICRKFDRSLLAVLNKFRELAKNDDQTTAKEWSEEEVAEIRAYIAQYNVAGKKPILSEDQCLVLAIRLNRSPKSIRNKFYWLKRLSTGSAKNDGNPWTPNELETIAAYINQERVEKKRIRLPGHLLKQWANQFERSPHAVKNRYHLLCLATIPRQNNRWKPDELETLKQNLFPTQEQLALWAERFDHPIASVRQKVYALRKEAGRAAQHRSPSEE